MLGGDWLLAVAPPLGRAYLGMVRATTRFRSSGGLPEGPGGEGCGPVIVALWHNRLLGGLLAAALNRRSMGVVISRSRDGELISRVVGGFGCVPIRGSSSRGGALALRGVLRRLERGGWVAFTPDGPRGPRYAVQPGVAYAAARSGCPVLPIGVAMSRKRVFRSWDRFQLPLPFGTIALRYGEPIAVPREADVAAVQEQLRRVLHEVNRQAERDLRTGAP